MKRSFISENLVLNTWSDIQSYFDTLLNFKLSSETDLNQWLAMSSELDAFLEENLAWRYIKMSCDTTNTALRDDYFTFVNDIEPHIADFTNLLNKKLADFAASIDISSEPLNLYLQKVKNKIEIFHKDNIPLIADIQTKQQEYGKCMSELTVTFEDKELTMQQASVYLKKTDREVRKLFYELINERYVKEWEKLHNLYTELIKLRHKMAVNSGFGSFTDYRFKEMCRFDYSANDCKLFHNTVKSLVCPLVADIYNFRKSKLNVDSLKPYDLDVDINLLPPLKPFANADEMVEKTIQCFTLIDENFGKYLQTMKEKGFLDLESRKGKAPGGFNYPLHESNVPFIFMNSAGTLNDLKTIVHEGGHAVHAFLCANQPLVYFKETPMEVAELASMGMELISMEYWHIFIPDANELKRAKIEQLENCIKILPWIATIDKFQHWVYSHPAHSIEDRIENWTKIAREFSSDIIDRQGYEWYFVNAWQKQLHLFEVPFYYIEYGIAQLGSIALWRNFKQNPQKTIEQYKNALSAGATLSIPEIYKLAGIKFDFSENYIGELMNFVKNEIELLKL